MTKLQNIISQNNLFCLLLNVMVKSLDFAVEWPNFESWFHHLPDVGVDKYLILYISVSSFVKHGY